jgi:hypothetical protein
MYKHTKDRMSKDNITSIGLTCSVKDRLELQKLHPREPFYSVISRLLDRLEHE